MIPIILLTILYNNPTLRRVPDAPFRGLGLGFIGFGVLDLGSGFKALVLSLGVSF